MADGIEMSRRGGHPNLRIQAGALIDRSAGQGRVKPGGHPGDRVIAGAAGGPKWLIFSHVDCVLLGVRITGRRTPLYLVGSSSGAWRFATAAQADSLAALDRLRADLHRPALLPPPRLR